MSELAGLEVKVTADLTGLVKEMKKADKSVSDLKNQLARFKTQLDATTDPKSVLRLNKAIEGTEARIKSLSASSKTVGSGLNNMAGASNTAGQSLQNLSRIAQDAPFGFIGIANNINPLLESFQRLRKESGSTGGALKALVGSLAGGGGLGLAFGVVTAAISFASIGMQAWGGSNKKAKEAVDENKKATEDFSKALKDVERDGIRTGLSLQGFVSIARDQTQSLATRNHALEEANKILGEHGDKLTLVNIATQAVTDQINKFTQATIQQALAAKFADRAADLFINQKDAAKAYGVELKKLQALQAKTQVFTNNQGVEVLTDAGKATQAQIRVVAQLATAYKGVTNDVKGIVNELTAAQVAASQLFGGLDGEDKLTGIIAKLQAKLKGLTEKRITLIDEKEIFKTNEQIKTVEAELDRLLGKKRKSETVKDIRTIGDVIDNLRVKIKELNTEEFTLNTDNAQERVAAFLNAIKELAVKFKLDPEGKIIKGLFDEAKFAKLGFVFVDGFAKLGIAAGKAFRNAITDDLKNNPIQDPTPTGFNDKPIESGLNGDVKLPKLDVNFDQLDELAKIAFLKSQGITKGIQDGINTGLEGLRFPELTALFNSAKDRLEGFNKVVTALLQENLLNTFSGLGDALGKALSGSSAENIFGSFFKNILDSLGSGLQKLGATMLATNKAISLVKSTLGTAPGIGASVGLIALGTLIKALSARIKVPGFANGVENFAGGFAMVGERGPELVRLPRGSGVIPNHELNGMSIGGGQNISVYGRFELRGSTAYALVQKGSEQLRRQS